MNLAPECENLSPSEQPPKEKAFKNEAVKDDIKQFGILGTRKVFMGWRGHHGGGCCDLLVLM
jgi:hypothetical protein